jgi:hypothetical protein
MAEDGQCGNGRQLDRDIILRLYFIKIYLFFTQLLRPSLSDIPLLRIIYRMLYNTTMAGKINNFGVKRLQLTVTQESFQKHLKFIARI